MQNASELAKRKLANYTYEDIEFFLSLTTEELDALAKEDLDEVTRVLEEYEYLLCESNLYHFFKSSWHCSDPANLLDNWHYECIAEHLEAVSLGQILRLAVTVPPRSGKSKLCSVAYPTWEWGPADRPGTKFLSVSHTEKLAKQFSINSRNIIKHKWYSKWFGVDQLGFIRRYKLADDSDTLLRIDNNHGGYRIGVTPNMDIMGFGFDICLIDDALDGADADSPSALDKVNSWYSDVLINRANDPKTARIIIIQQRLAQLDLVGYVKKKDYGYFELVLPNEYNPKYTFISPIGFNDIRKTEGELLMPNRFDDEFIVEQKKKPIKYATLYQQQPVAAEGNVIRRDTLIQGYALDCDPKFQDYVVIVADLTFGKSLNTEDKSCIEIYGKKNNKINLLGELRGEWDIKGQMAALKAAHHSYRMYNLQGIYIEEKANGRATLDLLKNKLPNLHPFKPSQFGFSADKRDRLNAVMYVLEELRFRRPNPEDFGYAWVTDWLDELCGFPRWSTDDRVDCLVIALKVLEALPTLDSSLGKGVTLPTLPKENTTSSIRELLGSGFTIERSNVRQIFK